jgi:hypothetical protein
MGLEEEGFHPGAKDGRNARFEPGAQSNDEQKNEDNVSGTGEGELLGEQEENETEILEVKKQSSTYKNTSEIISLYPPRQLRFDSGLRILQPAFLRTRVRSLSWRKPTTQLMMFERSRSSD